MPVDTNGVSFFTPPDNISDDEGAVESASSSAQQQPRPSAISGLDSIKNYGMKMGNNKTKEKEKVEAKTSASLVFDEKNKVKSKEILKSPNQNEASNATSRKIASPKSAEDIISLKKFGSTDTIVGPSAASKARHYNMTEIDYSVTGITSAFAPVPSFKNDDNSTAEQTGDADNTELKDAIEPEPSLLAELLKKAEKKKRNSGSLVEVDSPSPKRRLSRKKSPASSDFPEGYFEAKKIKDQKRKEQKRNKGAPSKSKSVSSEERKKSKKSKNAKSAEKDKLGASASEAQLETVDSEVFDTGPFKPNYAMGHASDHTTSSPFELSTTPIEVNESRIHKTIEINNRENPKTPVNSAPSSEKEKNPDEKDKRRSSVAKIETTKNVETKNPDSTSTAKITEKDPKRARLESQNDGCLSPSSLKTALDELQTEPRCKSPQHLDLHTFRDAVDVNYQRMAITGEELSGVPLEDLRVAAEHLIEALQMRSKYMERIGNQFPTTTRNFLTGYFPANLPKHRVKNTETTVQTSFNPPDPPKDHWGKSEPLPKYEKMYTLKRNRGVTEIFNDKGEIEQQFKDVSVNREEFLSDTEKLTAMIVDGPLKSFCFRRLSYLQNKFQLHVLLNELRELHEQKGVSHRDFYNIRKVDTHIHAASSMNQKHLLRFIKKKIKTEADTVVLSKDGQNITMKDVFKKMGIDAYDLSVDMLDVHADRNTFHRFDKFNTKYNPVGESTLREIFIKTDNYVGGKYFADLLKEVLSDLEDSKYQHAEPRLSIYGREKSEWDKLAKWAIHHDVWSQNVRWLIQIPRLYDIYRAKNMVNNFDELLDNIFSPLFEVTNDPSTHPELHLFLQQVSGIDSVDDESKHEFVHFDRLTPCPPEYTDLENPPYNYYLFYMYANICALNAFRRARGLNTFALRPHCGEAGHVSHLLTGYLTSESIAHGILLRKVPVLQYLFYLTQIGIAMSPLSNNSLFISYQRNPLPEYLQKGLNVSLSTDDPLQFHYTKEALMEEYSIAAQVWKLSSCDMCELARNSVIQSGFEDKVKIHWLGPNYKEEGVLGNDIHRTNVPDIRVSFRHEALVDELFNLFRVQQICKQ